MGGWKPGKTSKKLAKNQQLVENQQKAGKKTIFSQKCTNFQLMYHIEEKCQNQNMSRKSQQ